MTKSYKTALLGLAMLLSMGVALSPKTANSQAAPTATIIPTPIVEDKPYRTFSGFNGQIDAVSFLPDGRGLMAVGLDGTSRLWNVDSAEVEQVYTNNANPLFNISISENAGDEVFATSGGDLNNPKTGTVYIYELQTGKLLMKLATTAAVDDLAFIPPDGNYLLTASEDSVLSIFDWKHSSIPAKTFDATFYKAVVDAVMVNKAGTQILTGADDGKVFLWQLDIPTLSLTQIEEYDGLTGTVTSVAFSPDEKSVLGGDDSGDVLMWDAQTGATIHAFHGHTNGVNFVDFFPNGKAILTASDDATARIWDIATERETCELRTTYNIQDASISPDGKYVVTVTAAVPDVRMWSVCG